MNKMVPMVSGIFGVAACTVVLAQPNGLAAVNLNIEPLPVDQAISAWSSQTGLQVLIAGEGGGHDRIAPIIKGTYTPEQALQILLSNTDLGYRFVNTRTVAIGAVNGPAFRAAVQAEGGAPSTTADASSPQGGAADTKGLEEVIVTAQKRSERFQDVPTSMAVLSADKLESQGVQQLADYAKLVPGLRLVGGSGPGQGKPVLRGISTGSDRNSLVGIYLDDVPFTPSSTRPPIQDFSFDPSLADIDHIEVLKGPQSTFYGASAMGGLVKFVTKRPNLNNYEASVRVDGSQIDGGSAGYGVRASVNAPLVDDKVGARLSIFHRDDAGFIDDRSHGDKNANSDTVDGARLSLLAKFTDTLETTVSALAQNIDIDGWSNIFLDRATLQPSLGDLAYTSPTPQTTHIKYRAASDTLVWTMPWASLTNIASFARFSVDSRGDYGYTAPLVGYTGGVSFNQRPYSKRYSDELRLASNPGKLEWLLGGFYTNEKDTIPIDIRGTDGNGNIIDPSSPFYNFNTYRGTGSFKEKAVFGDLTYHFTEHFDATIGARYNTNDQNFTLVQTGLLANNNLGHPTSDSATNYLGTVTFKPNADLTMYVRAASAYRPGGPNALNASQLALGLPRAFDADTLWNYEVGIKGMGWDRRLTFSAAAYHMDWRDIQVNVIIRGSNGVNFSTTGNAAKAKSDGLDLSMGFAVAEGLEIGLNAAYNDAKMQSSAVSLGALDGDRLPYSPKVSGSAVVDYRSRGFNGVTPNASLTYAYYGKQNSAFGANNVELPAYGSLDLRGGIDWDHYSLIARVDNVTDKYAVTYAAPSNVLGRPWTGTVLRPRTFGLSFEARF